MKVVNISQVPKFDRGRARFHGVYHFHPKSDGSLRKQSGIPWIGSVISQYVVNSNLGSDDIGCKSDSIHLHVLNFAKGARTKFHTHNQEQMIIGYTGIGIQATEEGMSVVKAGDVIYFPAGEKHWHGASNESDFTQLSIFSGGRETHWIED